ncbi:sulfite exporter TauE/SafE family protein [Acidihalobacter prosperus]|uniref:Probable membrane transporter protein n=1 Tax=Acidihalobacter prosperus TaxID=160660 RepID=A0A1A6C7L1_9GAMM|nr:sulfite exporter TauE/SafE family protein [Acidihalobacter prosperus]OBS10534.1 hypothetical protein Thpro_020250 [Acidihalobacter prosperus]
MNAAIARRPDPRHRLRAASGVGLLSGVGGGLASLGGGTLLIPLLTDLLRLPALDARGTALAVSLVNALAGSAAYAAGGRIAWAPLFWAGLPALLIAPLAARLSRDWRTRGLRIAFGLVVMLGGIALFAAGMTPPDGFARGWPHIYLLFVGVLSGAVAGVAGISGGPVLVPLFVLGLGMPQALAQGSSLITRLPATLSGLWENVREGHVSWHLLPWLALGGLIGSLLGARLALALPEHLLRWLFAGLLIALGLFEIMDRPGHRLSAHHHDPYP